MSTGLHINEWVSTLADHQPYYLAIFDGEGRLSFTNSQFYNSFLPSGGPAAGHSFFDLVDQNDRIPLQESLATCLAQEEAVVTELRVLNGRTHWVKWQIGCVRKPQQIEKFICLGYDIADKDPNREEAIIVAREAERTRIGHELHDNVNQILASGQLYLSLLHQDTENFREIKNKTMEILNMAIEEIRTLSRSMVVQGMKAGGLIASIKDLINDLRYCGLFVIGFTHSDICDLELLNQNKKVALFRIVQEQTRNILKYSKAKRISISLEINFDRVRLEIKDDGQGFDPENTQKGLGLSNIFERARLYNGKALLNTSPGKGCSVIVNIPRGNTNHPTHL
ncbi:MAG TPA: ATP-binding protein [Puia sp.]|jgi:PAS domain S-box-containing protein